MSIKCTYTTSVRVDAGTKPLVEKTHSTKAQAETWLNHQREVAKRAGWAGLRFETKERCESTRKRR